MMRDSGKLIKEVFVNKSFNLGTRIARMGYESTNKDSLSVEKETSDHKGKEKEILPRRRGGRRDGTKEETTGTADYGDSDKEGKEEKRKHHPRSGTKGREECRV
jgi:hypothetical protein